MCTVYDRMYGDFPAKNTVYTPYEYNMVLDNPIYVQTSAYNHSRHRCKHVRTITADICANTCVQSQQIYVQTHAYNHSRYVCKHVRTITADIGANTCVKSQPI